MTIFGNLSRASIMSNVEDYLFQPKTYHFEISFGFCQVNVDLVDFGGHHWEYAWATNCGGHYSGSGTFTTRGDGDENEKVDESSVTFAFDDTSSQTYFNNNGGSQKLIDGLVTAF